ncbi:MAG: CDP-alcohol phosphatidyltransferase family protein [Thermoproteota archaeon]
MLNNLRDSLQPIMTKLGTSFASTGLSANFWTGLGLVISIAAGIVYASPAILRADGDFGFGTPFALSWTFYTTIIGGILLLISGFFDIVDGSVARVTKQASKKGAFLDSSFDKISEVVIFGGIAAGGLASPFWCLVALGLSLLVSYARARAESLGVELKGIGIGERAERMLILAIIGMIPIPSFYLGDFGPTPGGMYWAVIIVSIVAGITLIQRIATTAKKLSST